MRAFVSGLILSLMFGAALSSPSVTAADTGTDLRVATTTSLENAGLLARLLPDFETQCDCRARVIPVGTGRALELGRRGDVDALLVHAPEAEMQFIKQGYGVKRHPIAYNYFILLVPPADPAGIAALADSGGDIFDALRAIAKNKAAFLSRGDDSGTHKKELSLWRQLADAHPEVEQARQNRDWYIESGSGMGQAILMAEQLRAYTLSDKGTYLHLRNKVTLRPVTLPPSALLYNPYSAIRISEARHPHIKVDLAEQFISWLQHPDTRRRIAGYRLFGEPLFTPATPPAPATQSEQ